LLIISSTPLITTYAKKKGLDLRGSFCVSCNKAYNWLMSTLILATKLYIPPTRPELVPRPRLIERLNEILGQKQGFDRKLTLISAPAGFGKTTLVSDWFHQSKVPVAWLSLDESDNDLTRFLTYFVAALQTIESAGNIGKGALNAL
jgi:LuxR family maltose regulon positive regulatory protein